MRLQKITIWWDLKRTWWLLFQGYWSQRILFLNSHMTVSKVILHYDGSAESSLGLGLLKTWTVGNLIITCKMKDFNTIVRTILCNCSMLWVMFIQTPLKILGPQLSGNYWYDCVRGLLNTYPTISSREKTSIRKKYKWLASSKPTKIFTRFQPLSTLYLSGGFPTVSRNIFFQFVYFKMIYLTKLLLDLNQFIYIYA